MRVELIDYREPEEGQLYVSRIKWDKDSGQLYQVLRERFGIYGLLHMIKPYQSGNVGDFFLILYGSLITICCLSDLPTY